MYKVEMYLNDVLTFSHTISWNLSNYFYSFLDKRKGLRWLDGKKSSDSVERLKYAISFLGSKTYTGPFHVVLDSWQYNKEERDLRDEASKTDLDAPGNEELLSKLKDKKMVFDTGGAMRATPGNAGYNLDIILKICERFPEGVWIIE